MSEQVLENRGLRVEIDRLSGAFDVVEKQTGTRWERDAWQGSAGEVVFASAQTGREIRCNLSKSERIVVAAGNRPNGATVAFQGLRSGAGDYLPGGAVRTELWLDGDEADLLVQIASVSDESGEWRFVSLNYPCRFGFLRTLADPGFLVIPFLQGCLLPSHHFPRQGSEFWMIDDEFHSAAGNLDLPTYSNQGLWMPWAGVTKGEHGFLFILETDDDAGANVVANYDQQAHFALEGQRSPYPRIAAVSPWWRPSLGDLRYPRRCRYRFFPRASHVTLAKAYREHARRAGLLRPLTEKIAAKPQLERLVGATCVVLYGGYPHYTSYPTMDWTFQDVTRIGRDIVEGLGLHKLFVNLWGGYSHLPPDSFPFDPRKGDVSELARAVAEMQAAGLIFSLYHAYSPMLEKDAPWYGDALIQTDSGGTATHRWDRTCSSQYVRFAQKNMPAMLKQVRPLADYTDLITVLDLSECYSPSHPQSRTDDRLSKAALFDYLGSLGPVVGSESTRAWGAPHLDYHFGCMYRVHHQPLYLFRFNAPLWQLVFHECGPVFRHTEESYTSWYSGDYQTKCLQDLAFGVNPMFTIAFRDWPAWRLKVRESQALVGAFAGEVAYQEMIAHELLSEDSSVFRTTYDSGASVTANVGIGAFELEDGRKLQGYGYVLRRPDGQERRGRFRAEFESSE